MSSRDEEVFRLLAASAGAEARRAPPKASPGNGRGKKAPSDATDETRARADSQPPEPPAKRYPDIPSQVETGSTPPAKRWLDLGVAGLMIGVLWPVFGLAALLIKLESTGPVMIKQKRVGLDGKTFYFYKFRSMHDRKRADDLPERLPTGDLKKRLLSPRGRPLNATAVGWTLRKTTVDELPQLLNVVRGEMSLVGPRPDIPEIVDHWPPEFRQRHQVKPGMTGLAQVNGRSDLTHYEKVKYDLRYVRHHPITRDLRILLKTIGLVISKKGAR
jgi:lipopolysaccharide/colanic/teichoic acid biosynthesis glycosyltransferase